MLSDPAERSKLLRRLAAGFRRVSFSEHIQDRGRPAELRVSKDRIDATVDYYRKLVHWYKDAHNYASLGRINCDKICALTVIAIMKVRPFAVPGGKTRSVVALIANEGLALRCMHTFLHVPPEKLSSEQVDKLISLFTQVGRADASMALANSLEQTFQLIREKHGRTDLMAFED
ncbi:MAG: hypothetical protein O9277_09315 [Magnetospirillum sp.]|nr:hypothetical protein [Magnetospirillum sp.]